MFGEGRLITWQLYNIHLYRETHKLSTPLSEIAPFGKMNAFSS